VFELSAERVEEIRRQADRGGKVLPRFDVLVVGADGKPVARVEKTLHVRRADASRRMRIVAQS
jgi:hypothetical protein